MYCQQIRYRIKKEILYHHLFDDKDDVIENEYKTFFAGCDNKPELKKSHMTI